MHRRACLALTALPIAGCAARSGPDMTQLLAGRRVAAIDGADPFEELSTKSQFMQDVMNDPDLPGWHEAREKMALALGDRVFERGFDRVFDSMTVALASLGARVHNMERTSGYITGSIPDLGPARTEALSREGLRQYAAAKGYNPALAEPSRGGFDMDAGGSARMMSRFQSGLTISMVRQGPTQTKVKLRFDNVYYPALVGEYYKTVWAAVDKQIFLDRALD
jgi:hypothetical protein